MRFFPMWPETARGENILEEGVEIVLEEEDAEERQHLFQFLRSYFGFEGLQSFENISFKDDARYPKCHLDGEEVHFVELITMDEIDFGEIDEVMLCFTHELQPLFRAYKSHLDQDRNVEFELEEFKNFYAMVEKIVFGSSVRPN